MKKSSWLVLAFLFVATGSFAADDDPLAAVSAEKLLGKTRAVDLVARYDEMARKDPGNPAWYVMSAEVYRRRAGSDMLDKALGINPKYAPAYVSMAHTYSATAPPRAIEAYAKAIEFTTGDTDALRLEAVTTVGAGQIMNIAPLRALAGDSFNARLRLIQALIAQSNFNGATEELSLLPATVAKDPRTLAEQGRLLIARGQRPSDPALQKQGLEMLLAAWSQSPASPDFYSPPYDRILKPLPDLLSGAGRNAEARAVWEKAMEMFPAKYSYRLNLWQTWFDDVKKDYSAERAKVREAITQLLKSEKPSAELVSVVAQGYAMAGDTAAAKQAEARLMAEFPYSSAAAELRTTEINSTADAKHRAELLESFNRDFIATVYRTDSQYLEALNEAGASAQQFRTVAEAYFNSAAGQGYPATSAVLLIGQVFCYHNIFPDLLESWIKPLQPDPDAVLKKDRLTSNEALLLAYRAKIALQRGQAAQAEQMLRQVVAKADRLTSEQSGRVRSYLADAVLAAGKKDEALILYAEALNETNHSWTTGASHETEMKFRRAYLAQKGSAGMEAFLNAHQKGGEAATSDQSEAELNRPVPQVSLLNLKGERVKFSDLRGKVVIVNFWATWCAPCRKEMPELETFYEKWKNDPKVAVVAISVDKNRALVEPFIKTTPYTFPILLDEGAKEAFGVGPIPETFVIDPSGTLRLKITGYNGSPLVPHLEQLVQRFGTK
jgi:thiol-disulfide isomerase/thioredoxin/Tfp pilus assembly protein PilF